MNVNEQSEVWKAYHNAGVPIDDCSFNRETRPKGYTWECCNSAGDHPGCILASHKQAVNKKVGAIRQVVAEPDPERQPGRQFLQPTVPGGGPKRPQLDPGYLAAFKFLKPEESRVLRMKEELAGLVKDMADLLAATTPNAARAKETRDRIAELKRDLPARLRRAQRDRRGRMRAMGLTDNETA